MITKNISLKHVFIYTFLFISLINLTRAQESEWCTPIPITDSLTNNSNPAMIRISHRDYVFYEKQTDENTSTISMRNITEMDEPIDVFYQDNTSFRNPQIIKFSDYPNEPDTLFFLIFESDLVTSGVFNIYYSKYSQDGNFTEPESIEISYISCQNLQIMGRNLIWERGGNIETTYLQGNSTNYYFHPTITIDEGVCSNPCISESDIIYLKDVNDDQRIYRAKWNYPSGEWHEPVEFYGGINSSLSILTYESEYGEGFLWETFDNGSWNTFSYDVFDDEIVNLELESDNKLSPHAVLFGIIVKQKEIWINYFTYAFSENDNTDIFVSNLYDSPQNCFNISQSSANESNPQLFYLPASFVYNTYLIYQSKRNNHQQLFISKSSFLHAGTDELNKEENNLIISPNPITHQTQITTSLSSTENLKIEIYNSAGVLIETLPLKNTTNTIWKPSKELKNGIYIFNLKSDTESIRKKVILQR